MDLTIHPISQGEAMVYRDMAELTRREVELRQHWKSIGLFVPAVARWNEEPEVDDISDNVVPSQADITNVNSLCEAVADYESVNSCSRSSCSCSSSVAEMEHFSNKPANDTGLREQDNAAYDITRNSEGFRRYPLDVQDLDSNRRLNCGGPKQPCDESFEKRPENSVRDTISNGSLCKPTCSAFVRVSDGKGVRRTSREEAQQRIQDELNEVKRREAELR
jgi:hypothetical protein